MLAKLICPSCKSEMVQQAVGRECSACRREYPCRGGVLCFLDSKGEFNLGKFQGNQTLEWTKSARLRDRIRQSQLLSCVNRLRIRCSLSGRRDRIFFNEMRNGDRSKLILDVGCGGGRHYFCDYGQVVGVDPVLELLKISKMIYAEVYQASATQLPFADNSFDYVVSSDVIGHIPFEIKDQMFAEMYRVLKKGGRTCHVIETDGNNRLMRFAHSYPELYQKYFIDIPGHISLELRSQVRARFCKHGFREIAFQNIAGAIPECGGLSGMFGCEYLAKSRSLRYLASLDRLLARNLLVKETINILLEPLAQLEDLLMPFDHPSGALVVFEK
jgi:ubiquinone/menaquinone biosynthesis C-methylase UbiE